MKLFFLDYRIIELDIFKSTRKVAKFLCIIVLYAKELSKIVYLHVYTRVKLGPMHGKRGSHIILFNLTSSFL